MFGFFERILVPVPGVVTFDVRSPRLKPHTNQHTSLGHMLITP